MPFRRMIMTPFTRDTPSPQVALPKRRQRVLVQVVIDRWRVALLQFIKPFRTWLVVGLLHQIRSYWDIYRIMTVQAHGDVIVPPHWDARSPEPGPDITLSHIKLALSQTVLVLS